MTITKDKTTTMLECCKRLEKSKLGGRGYSRQSMMTTLHYADQDIAIDFDRLLAADDVNFFHDMIGLAVHMDKKLMKIGNCFVPRFAM